VNKAAIIQSNYIPWKGYFDIIHDVDIFIFYDDVQFTKNDWRHRNKVKTPNGTAWLSVPVGTDINRFIYQVEIKDAHWQQKHWKTFIQYYSKTPFLKEYYPFFESIYLAKEWNNLSELNQFVITSISREILGITTIFKDSREYNAVGQRTGRLIDILKKVKADVYISGPRAKGYIDEKQFDDAGIKLIFKDYSKYPEYPQLYPPFDHCVSIIDLIFNVGPDAPKYIWG